MPHDASTEPVRDVAELRAYLERGGRPVAAHCLGVEHEKIGVLADGRPPSYEGHIAPLLARLEASPDGHWTRIEEAGRIIGLRRVKSTVTLEPGGQFEYSDQPRKTAAEAARALEAHWAELEEPARAAGVTWIAAGFRPFGTLDDVPWMPKGRYAVMRAYLPTRGSMAHEMMKRTATVQANVDWSDAADCADKVRTGMGLTSLITALWANSPIVDGKLTDYQSWRARCWLDTDDDRCGLLPFVFDERAGERLFADYTEWALDVPMFFVYRGGGYTAAAGMTFRRFLREGFQGERATISDWELHLSTLFPEVRLRPHIEVRAADAGTRDMVRALGALYRGVLYDAEARRAAWALVAGWSWEERNQLRRDVPQRGLRATVGGAPILERCRELVEIARAGLARLGGDDVALLDPVAEVARSGHAPADRVAEIYRAAGGDPARMIPALTL